jgi:rhodanese-related sulfurtransferase/uncharacterized membrane protein YphA (DoxX/SURF4 family)
MDHWTIRKLSGARSLADPGRVIFLVSRLFLGGIFAYASLDKILRPAPFAEIVFNYQMLPDLLVNLAAILLPWIELLVGLILIAGIWLPGALLISNLLLLVFFSSLVFNMMRGLDIDCGCFTSSVGPSSGGNMMWYLLRDGFFLLVGGFLFFSFFSSSPSKASRISKPWKTPLLQVFVLGLLSAILGFVVNQSRSDSLPLPGDWSPKARMTLKFGKNILIPLDEARNKFLTGGTVFVDARPAAQYQEGHIRGALSLPLADFDQLVDKVVMAYPEDTLFVTYCEGEECALAAEVALKLKKIGFENVRVLHDGWNVWKDNRLPSQTGDAPG